MIHGGIDGFSRLIVYLSCSAINLAAKVHALFAVAVEKNGWPSKVRSDKGGENLDVAASMLRCREMNRGSIIAGLSVHNKRIERLWRDVFVGVGHFYTLFYHMEERGILESTNIIDLLSFITFFVQEFSVK